jgi:hypothetical protein
MTATLGGPSPYPVRIEIERRPSGRNRLTTLLRPILAIPHAIAVGAPGFAIGTHATVFDGGPGYGPGRPGGEG